tara:strand:- start:1426 stop:2322 length:897 start_codon:yes stop_codon:yes gene_type:complete
MVTISPTQRFASVTRIQSGFSETFSRTVTATPGPNEVLVSTSLSLDREFHNFFLEPATTNSIDNIITENGDNIVFNRTNLSGADAGDKLQLEAAVVDANVLLEEGTPASDEDEVRADTDVILLEDTLADSEPNITITNGVSSATTSGFYSRRFTDIGQFVIKGESDLFSGSFDFTGIDNMPLNHNDDSLGKKYTLYSMTPDATDQHRFTYSVTVLYYEEIEQTEFNPVTSTTTTHKIRSSIKTFSATLTHAVMNDLSFIGRYVSSYYAQNRIQLEDDEDGINEEAFILLEDENFVITE